MNSHTLKLISGITLAFGAVVAQANLVQNSSFEGSGSWTITGSAGVLTNAFMTALANIQGNSTPFGDKVMAFNVANSFPNGVATQTVAGTSGAPYQLSFYVGAVGAGPTTNQKIRVRIINASNSSVAFDSVVSPSYATRIGDELIDLVRFDFAAPSASFKVEFSDQSAFEAAQDIFIDNVSIEPRTESAPLAGSMTLESITPSKVLGTRATVMLKLGGQVVELQRTMLGNNGNFFATTSLRGTYEVAVKAPTWLSKSLGVIGIGDAGAFGLNATLHNGDCDGNNIVNTDDYLILSNAFDSSTGDPTYNLRADLNQDGIVNTDDYLVLNESFDQVGE